ncbi:MAG: DinB family protein [Pirellulales bacterium]|nr:DinB family protein [Pirellulales bacterium]
MFENEIANNELMQGWLAKVLSDVRDEAWFEPSPGHGHPPVWILGHLAICGELGQMLLGGKVVHENWLPLFGPGSSDRVAADISFAKSPLHAATTDAYADLRKIAAAADAERLNRPHGLELFADTSIRTIGHVTSMLLTNHFAFHLSQLSSCRRTAGHRAIF